MLKWDQIHESSLPFHAGGGRGSPRFVPFRRAENAAGLAAMMALISRQAAPARIGAEALPALIALPSEAKGLVILAHGPGESRFSPASSLLADGLHAQGMATVLLDLLHPGEEQDMPVPDLALLAARLFSAVEWISGTAGIDHLPIGYCGAGHGAQAAILAASGPDRRIHAIIILGGHFGMAGPLALARIRAPVQVIAGSRDLSGAAAGRAASAHLTCTHEVVTITGAGQELEEPGTLRQVIDHMNRWFSAHFPRL